MADWVETFRGAVLASEYDSRSYMNSQLYVSRFDQSTWFLLGQVGLTPRSCAVRHCRVAVVRQNFQYLRELKGGELVIVRSGFTAVGKKHFRFLHQMLDQEDGQLIATSDVVAVEASLDSGKTQALPAQTRAQVEAMLISANVAEPLFAG
jgi:acyl-CoA thioesterase FadM